MSGRGRGRPPKRVGSERPNAGRKKLKVDRNTSLSRQTIDRRARELIRDDQINRAVLERALKLLEPEATEQENESDNETVGTVPHTPQSAFAFFLENDYSVAEYMNLSEDAKNRIFGAPPIYPPYEQIYSEKKKCLEGLEITEASEVTYQVSFQSLLNKSAERLMEGLENITNIPAEKLASCELYVSYGFDASAGHKNPHQGFDDEQHTTNASHQSLFASVMVLLALKCDGEFIWVNETPQSVRYCRPLRLSYESETSESTKIERDRLQQEVDELVPHQCVINGKEVTVKFNTKLTLLDGKALNNVLDNDATTRCPICKLTMKYFNTPAAYNTHVEEDALQHGLGLLHCEIKSFEYFLHLSYKSTLGLSKWNCPSGLKGNLKNLILKIKHS